MFTRRALLKAGGLAVFAASLGGTPLFLGRAAQAAPGMKRRTLVTIFQRGAMDGLMAVPPLGDAGLAKLRPALAMGVKEGVLELDGRFGLHPALAPLAPHFRAGRLAVVHGVGSPDPTRSHFDAQDYMETGTPGRKGTTSGWLNRAVGLMGHEATPFQAVALAPALPRSFYGPEAALAVSDLAEFGVAQKSAGTSLEALYAQTNADLLRGTGRESFEAMKLLSPEKVRAYKPAAGAAYPNSPLGRSLKQVAMLVKWDVGLEVAFAETGGWDTHVQQGTVRGSFAARARDLAESVAAFWTDLGDRQDEVCLMTMTEFGRTVRQNGSGGTDHGRGSCLFVLGNGVRGGRVLGEVPPLQPDRLDDGRDLPVTTDFRAVFTDVAQRHLGLRSTANLFPGFQGKTLQVLG